MTLHCWTTYYWGCDNMSTFSTYSYVHLVQSALFLMVMLLFLLQLRLLIMAACTMYPPNSHCRDFFFFSKKLSIPSLRLSQDKWQIASMRKQHCSEVLYGEVRQDASGNVIFLHHFDVGLIIPTPYLIWIIQVKERLKNYRRIYTVLVGLALCWLISTLICLYKFKNVEWNVNEMWIKWTFF